MKLMRRKPGLVITCGLVAALLGTPWLLLWRQYRLDRDLIAAVRRNDTQDAIVLLNRGADANAHDAPHVAVSPWRLLWSRLRGKPVAPANTPTPLLILLDPLPRAATWGPVSYLPENVPLVNALLDHGAKINTLNATDPNGLSPLDLAIMSGKEQTVHLLLARGADVRPMRIGTRGLLSVPLLWACAHGNNIPVVTDLLDHGAKLNDRDSLGQTPLFAAVTRFHVDIVRLLLARHPDLSPRDIHGKTVLMWIRQFRNAPELREIAPLVEQAAANRSPEVASPAK